MTGLVRIIVHWTGGTGLANSSDLDHYHVLIESDGKVRYGRHKPEANRDVSNGQYAAHTRALNTGSIGVALCGMHGARETPFRAGDHAITEAQVDALAGVCADMCATYGIPVKARTVLTHAEVERTLGVAQRGKWDVTWLPGMDAPGDAIEVGRTIRAMVRKALTPAAPAPAVSNAPWWQGIVDKVLAWMQSKR